MSQCPDCGRENEIEPAGYITLCGRRVAMSIPSDDWRDRMLIADACKRAARWRERPPAMTIDTEANPRENVATPINPQHENGAAPVALEGPVQPPRYVVVDVETSGLMNFRIPADAPSQPYLASFAMILVDTNLNVECEIEMLIKPDGWAMTPETTAINGLTTERLLAEGTPIVEALQPYLAAVDEGRIVVAFNAQFDLKFFRSSCRRNSLPDRFETTPNICVMRGATDVCGLPSKSGGGFKFPKLSEAMVHFGIEQSGAHTALGDARSALEIFRRLHALGKLPEARVHYAKDRDV